MDVVEYRKYRDERKLYFRGKWMVDSAVCIQDMVDCLEKDIR